jgi:hypothetical protein
MRRAAASALVALLALASPACGSKNGSSHPLDGAADSGGGGVATGGSASGGAGSAGRTGAGGSPGLGGAVTGGRTGTGTNPSGGAMAGGSVGAGGGLGGGGSGSGGSPRDAASGDAPMGADGPPQTNDGPAPADTAVTCPDHMPVLPAYPYTPENCSVELNVSKLRCTYSAPLLGADGGPICDQTYVCQCVSGQGGPVACYWQADVNPVCPDGGATPADASRADAAAADAATAPLCGGKTCAADEVCCGPAECGRCIKALTGPNCPSSCSASMCGPSGQACATGEICVDVALSAGPMIGSTTATCVANPCGTQSLDCACAGTACTAASAQTTCASVDPATGLVRCVGGNKCAAPDTPIATPTGERPIAELRPGDLVFSADDGALVAVPLLQVSRTPAAGHVVVHLVTARGAVLDVSGPHPTADGRHFADLKVGDTLDGAAIVRREVVPYPHAFTYDILPASSTGTYVAAGMLIGSTLKEEPH